MNSPASPVAAPTCIRLRRESILALPFGSDARASVPRPLAGPVPPDASLAGVPAALRPRLGRNIVSTAFPYPRSVHTDGQMASVELELVELENAHWLVVLCPTLGGRILRIFDRQRRRELLLQPPALLQGVVGLAGAWFVGGVEFNAFRWGHNIHGNSTIETRRLRLPDGTPAVEFGACDELFSTEWRVRLALGEAQVFCRVELINHSRAPQPDYWWTTIAVPAHRHTRIMAAPGPMLHHGMFRTGYQHDQWPRLHGRDWSRWTEHHEVTSGYLYGNSSDFYGCVDERDGFGFVHQADHTICLGRKLWTVGAARGDMFSDRLLETAGLSYLELQSGLHGLQPEAGLLAPGERRGWTESFGAVSMPEAAQATDYAALFARYEHAAAAAMGAEYRARAAALAAAPVEEETLVAANPRVALSARIVREPAAVTPAEVSAAMSDGWVGGDAWRTKLRALADSNELTAAGRLALAVADLDAGDQDAAVAQLRALATDGTAAGGWAAYFLGVQTADRSALMRATLLLPGRAEPWLALDSLLARAGMHGERARLWADVPAALGARDDVRVVQASGALARREWAQARQLLATPLVTIAEGAPAAWQVYRESFLGEAVEQWRAGQHDGAAGLLFQASRPAPQFGMGRDEIGWSHDLLYYRWRLAKDQGRTLEATLLVEHGMLEEPYAGSVSAAYLARLAEESGHPSARARRRALAAWDDEGGPGARAFTPVRAAVIDALDGRLAGWEALRTDAIYLHRAAFELAAGSGHQ